MTKIPASDNFHDINEAAIKLIYGAHLEHQVSLIHLNRVGRASYEPTIIDVPNSNVLLGAVDFGLLFPGGRSRSTEYIARSCLAGFKVPWT
jgi:hypothetical protein